MIWEKREMRTNSECAWRRRGDENVCREDWRHALPDTFCFQNSSTSNKQKNIEIPRSFNIACTPALSIIWITYRSWSTILVTDSLNYIIKYNNPFVITTSLFPPFYKPRCFPAPQKTRFCRLIFFFHFFLPRCSHTWELAPAFGA
jgi:hypothetical protein